MLGDLELKFKMILGGDSEKVKELEKESTIYDPHETSLLRMCVEAELEKLEEDINDGEVWSYEKYPNPDDMYEDVKETVMGYLDGAVEAALDMHYRRLVNDNFKLVKYPTEFELNEISENYDYQEEIKNILDDYLVDHNEFKINE